MADNIHMKLGLEVFWKKNGVLNFGVSLQPITQHHWPNPDVYMSCYHSLFPWSSSCTRGMCRGWSGKEGDRRISARTHVSHNLLTVTTAIGRDS